MGQNARSKTHEDKDGEDLLGLGQGQRERDPRAGSQSAPLATSPGRAPGAGTVRARGTRAATGASDVLVVLCSFLVLDLISTYLSKLSSESEIVRDSS